MTWDDENYYQVDYDAAVGIIKHYRVDKMQHTEILETERKGEESFKDFDLAAFAKKTFWHLWFLADSGKWPHQCLFKYMIEIHNLYASC